MVPPGGIRGGRPSIRGSSRLSPRNWSTAGPAAPVAQGRPQASPGRAPRRVLFVCLGNSCRSQMAEAFARAYGGDILEAQSAGLSPAGIIQPGTIQVLREKNIPMHGQYPKGLELMAKQAFDVIVNMSGQRLPIAGPNVIDWQVPDPIGRNDTVYRNVAAQIEALVMQLVLSLRAS